VFKTILPIIQRFKPHIIFTLGCSCLFITLLLPSPSDQLPQPAWRVIGMASLMIIWWLGEVVPIAVTALMPLILSPMLGILPLKTVANNYAHPLIFLFMGGFFLSLALEKSGLHQRIALLTLKAFGSKQSRQIAGVMVVTAVLSMWMSNTATAVMMLPIGLSIIALAKQAQLSEQNHQQFAVALLLSIAYAANIGGIATLIGTPPNAMLAAYLSANYQINIGFAQWMLYGLPISFLLLVFCWFWLTRWGFKLSHHELPQIKRLLHQKLAELPPLSQAEKSVGVIFALTVIAWILRPMITQLIPIPLDDTMIILIAAVALFAIPSGQGNDDRLLNWENTLKMPWGILLLFGGGLALAQIMQQSGLSDVIVTLIEHQQHIAPFALLFIVVSCVVFLTEVTSNTAITASLLPLLGAISVSIFETPLMLAMPVAIAASCAFMLPVATPPNSVIFASGEVKIKTMAKTGFILNVVSISLISTVSLWLVPWFFE
jgi:sodium-dependent dicarboxylate transporter 2/3/5